MVPILLGYVSSCAKHTAESEKGDSCIVAPSDAATFVRRECALDARAAATPHVYGRIPSGGNCVLIVHFMEEKLDSTRCAQEENRRKDDG